MSLEIPTWDKIIGALGSTTSEIGGLWANLISDYYNGVDIGLLDPSKKPIIGTLTRYKFEKLGIFDNDQSHYIAFSADDIDTGGTRKVKFRRMNSPYEEDYAVLEGLSQELYNKTLNFANNTISNIPGSAIQDDSITNIKIKSDATISTSKLADSANFALKNAANVFTQTQKIGISATVSLTSFHATNAVANGTGFAFNLNNSTPTEITYAYIFGLINQNTAGSEQGSIGFYVRNGASLVDRMLLDHLNRLRVGVTGAGIYIDPTGISGGSKIVTFPNENIKALGEANVANITNKFIDIKSNSFFREARRGHYYCSASEGVDADGALYGLVGVGSQGASTVNTAGKYHIWNTRGVANDAAGVLKLDGFITRRRANPFVRFAFLFVANTNSDRRIFKGWTAQRLLTVNSNTEPLTSSEHGFLFGHGSSDTQFYIFHNDATGTCVKTPTGVNLPAINTNYVLEIQANNVSSGNFIWTLYNVVSPGDRGSVAGTGTINTRIPTIDIPLFMQDLVISIDTTIQSNNIHYIEVN